MRIYSSPKRLSLRLKPSKISSEAHEAQIVNYLRAGEVEVGVLLNFGKTPQYKRKVLTKEHKKQKSDLLKALGLPS